MNPTLRTPDSRPEAMADVQGGCDVALTRGIVLYREREEVEPTGGRIEDLGIGLVLEGRFAAEATVVDLGSGRTRTLDLSGALVVLDWAYEPTVDHIRNLIADEAREGIEGRVRGDRTPLAGYCFDLALRVLRRAGFGPLTRATFLRIGFRDICRDLDPHEGAAVRLSAGPGSLLRVHFDCDSMALVVRTSSSLRDPLLESALNDLFPTAVLHRVTASGPSGTVGYHLRLPLAVDAGEAREALDAVRRGLVGLIERYEPQRHRTVSTMLRTFGARDTLERVYPAGGNRSFVPVPGGPVGTTRVH
jgi:hypothetical protein